MCTQHYDDDVLFCRKYPHGCCRTAHVWPPGYRLWRVHSVADGVKGTPMWLPVQLYDMGSVQGSTPWPALVRYGATAVDISWRGPHTPYSGARLRWPILYQSVQGQSSNYIPFVLYIVIFTNSFFFRKSSVNLEDARTLFCSRLDVVHILNKLFPVCK